MCIIIYHLHSRLKWACKKLSIPSSNFATALMGVVTNLFRPIMCCSYQDGLCANSGSTVHHHAYALRINGGGHIPYTISLSLCIDP